MTRLHAAHCLALQRLAKAWEVYREFRNPNARQLVRARINSLRLARQQLRYAPLLGRA